MQLLTLKSVLVATDLSESAGPVLQTAARLASLAGASLHLLHVATGPKDGGEDRLRELFRLAAPDGVEPDSVNVAFGYPAAVIVQHAARLGADVIVVGPHRQLSIAGPLGSTAASVVRTASCPCLVASGTLRLPLERVLAAIDLEDTAGGTLPVALSWASALRPREAEARLIGLHVVDAPGVDGAREVLREHVDRARGRAYAAARVSITERIVHGSDPAGAILREVLASEADLIVMGARSTAETSFALGSVSAAVARATKCPLLLVPPASPVPTAP